MRRRAEAVKGLCLAPSRGQAAPAASGPAPPAARGAAAGRAGHRGSAEGLGASRCNAVSALGTVFGRYEERDVSYTLGWQKATNYDQS